MASHPSQRYKVAHLFAKHFVDIKFKVLQLYKLLILKRNSYCNVNKRLSFTRWTTLYISLDLSTFLRQCIVLSMAEEGKRDPRKLSKAPAFVRQTVSSYQIPRDFPTTKCGPLRHGLVKSRQPGRRASLNFPQIHSLYCTAL